MQRCAIGAVPPPRPSIRVDKALGKLPSYDKGLVDYVRRSKRVALHQTPASTPDVPAESSLYKSLDDFLYMVIKHAHQDRSTVPPWTEFNQIISNQREMMGSPTGYIIYLSSKLLLLRTGLSPQYSPELLLWQMNSSSTRLQFLTWRYTAKCSS